MKNAEVNEKFMAAGRCALNGAITPSIRAVTGAIDNSRIILRAIIDGALDDQTEENIQIAGTEVSADFMDIPMCYEEFKRRDAPFPYDDLLLDVVFYERD